MKPVTSSVSRAVWAIGCLMVVPLLIGLLAGLAPRAQATDGYGELLRFGSAGTGDGQFKLTANTHAFGVDPSDNSVYVGDEPTKGKYRIQKLTSSGAFVAQTAMFSPPNADGIEGVAVDPTLKRVYVLALESRSISGVTKAVAGTLYAFSTEPEGGTLAPASGTRAGVLTDPEQFASQAKPVSLALVEPHGIAVDPSTHDVIVMGEVESGTSNRPIALLRVSSAGTPGTRYTTTSLSREAKETASSPSVSSVGNVYIALRDEVAQVPSDFSSSEPPTRFGHVNAQAHEPEHVLLELPYLITARGDGLSYTPEGPNGESEGVFEAAGGIFSEKAWYPGMIAFSATNGEEIGWTGGQTRQVGEECAIGFGGITYPMVAAGGKGTAFVLDPQYSQVIELGPGGGGCPTAADGELKALVGGVPLSGEVAANTEVTLESTVVKADAISVEWNFDEEKVAPLTVAGAGRQHTEVTHTFRQGGEHLVTEVVHTDDLAMPIVEASTLVSVHLGPQSPTAVISGPIEVGVGQAALFEGGASWDANGHLGSAPITHYDWTFGDGASAETNVPEAQHAYAQAGLETASLVVEDSLGLKSEPSSIVVHVQVPAPPLVQEAAPVGPLGGAPIETATKTGTQSGGGSSAHEVKLARAALLVSRSGVASAAVSCVAGATRCVGMLVLRTLRPVRIRRGRRTSDAVLTLASAPFSLVGGHEESLKLRLSSAGRALLRRDGSLDARVTIFAKAAGGGAESIQSVVALRSDVKKLKAK